jgi:PAS domain S-box-containing protein
MQKQELDEILVSINDAIWSRTADTHRLIYGNKAYYDLYGVAPEDMDPEFDYILNSVYPPDRELMAAGIMAMKKTGKAEVVYRHHHVDGSMRTIRVQATLKKGSDGRPDVVTGISTDITQEKALFDAMRNTEQKLLATINNTRDLIWSVDRDLKLTFCNTAYQDFFRKRSGVALDEGDYVLGSWHSVSFIARRKKDYERALDGECFTVVVAENFNGTVQYNEISSTPIFNQEGWVVGVNCIARDITHQRRQLINVRMQNEKLKSVARKKMQTLKDQITTGHQPNGAGHCMDAALAAIESITAELIAISNNLDVTHPDTEDIISRT